MIQKIFDELRLTGELPTPSTLGLRILDLTREGDVDVDQLASTMMADPSLTGRLIKLAGASGSEPTSILAAAQLLDRSAIESVALSFALASDNRQGKSVRFDYDAYWALALATAVSAQILCNGLRLGDANAAFTLGLLNDVGQLALACVHPAKYSALLEKYPTAAGDHLARLETETFEINHIEVTAALMADWGLPEDFREAVLALSPGGAQLSTDCAQTFSTLLAASRALGALLVMPQEETDEWLRAFFSLEETATRLGIDFDEFLVHADLVAPIWCDWMRLLNREQARTSLVERYLDLADRGITEAPQERVEPEPESTGLSFSDEIENAIGFLDDGGTLDGAAVGGPAKPKTRILIVDDDQRMLRLLVHHLSREGCEVVTAGSSHEGLQKAFEELPQMVITDWMMPGMTGVQLCQMLRKSEAGKKMYVLIVTAREDDAQILEAFRSGVDDYIVKPFNPQILLARVRAGQRMIEMRAQFESSERERLKQVAELGIMTRKLRAAAMTDALTELPNRRYAMKRLKQEWDNSQRTGRPLSVVVGDIDFFKRINDRFGHDAGDAVLREIAHVMRSKSRSGDVLCRVGGEEFLSINISCDVEMASQGAERLRSAIEEYEVTYSGFTGNISMSFGVAQRVEGMASLDDLIKCADQALYEAKDGGRNKVVFGHWGEQRRESA
ncbi:MAG: diguanylate cyclase [bacterium]|nr:diguanylate cyclase [bacterium]